MFDQNHAQVVSWLMAVKAMSDRHYAQNFPNLEPADFSLEPGKKYIRVVVGKHGQRSAFAFIDMTNGDVLKPASWKTPAKWARGNVTDTYNGMKQMTPYGPEYLR